MKTIVVADDDDDKLHKKKTKGKSSSNGGSGGGLLSYIPTSVVCSLEHSGGSHGHAHPHDPGAVEVGLLITVLVLTLYLYGCYETYASLPDVPRIPNFRKHLGENLNLAINDFDTGGIRSSILRRKRKKAKKGKGKAKTDGVVGRTLEGDVEIPVGKWPVTLKEETYETILHPGDMKTELKVPKFWSKPLHNNKLMSRETAMKIGTCAQPDAEGNQIRGDGCPADQRTVLIMIASYRGTYTPIWEWAKLYIASASILIFIVSF